MKNILLAAALIFVAASAILAVANSRPALSLQAEYSQETIRIDDSNYLYHNIIF